MYHSIWKHLSTFISILLHPLIIPTALFFILYIYLPSLLSPWTPEGKQMIIGLIFFATYLLPVLFVLIYLSIFTSQSQISFKDLLLKNNKDRFRPFLLVGFIYAFLGYLLNNQLRANFVIVGIISVMATTIILCALISKIWKISIHAVGISGLTAFLLFFNERFADGALFYHVIASVLLSGFLLSARLYLNEHNILQVIGGWLIGLALTFGGIFYLFSF